MRRGTLGDFKNGTQTATSPYINSPTKSVFGASNHGKGNSENISYHRRRATDEKGNTPYRNSNRALLSTTSSRASIMTTSRSRPRSDPRPLNNKRYIENVINALTTFLIDNGYEHPVSTTTLHSPTFQNFERILVFMLTKIDPIFSFQKKLEQELPILLRCLRYPFSLPRSALSAIGSPHTWPMLIGVLSWLMGLLIHDEACKQKENEGLNLDSQTKRTRFIYENMNFAYMQFLNGADEFSTLDKELCDFYDRENFERVREVEKLQGDCRELAKMLHTLTTQPSPLELSSEHRDALKMNIEKYTHLIPMLLSNGKEYKNKLLMKEEEIKIDKNLLARLENDKEKLLELVDRQQKGGIDVERLKKESKEIELQLRMMTNRTYEKEREMKKAEELLQIARIEMASKLQMYQEREDKLEYKEVGRDLSVDVSEEGEFVSKSSREKVNFEKSILERIGLLRDKSREKMERLKNEGLRVYEESDEKEDVVILGRHELEMMGRRKENMDGEYHRRRDGLQKKIEKRQLVMRKREGELKQLSQGAKDRLKSAEGALNEVYETVDELAEVFLGYSERLVSIAEKERNEVVWHHQDFLNGMCPVGQYLMSQVCSEDEG